MTEEKFHSGFVAIVGRPNVGKSTLLNRLVGEKVSITSDKPQTTRNRIQGICNIPGAQIVFIDTPGIHRSHSRFNRAMVETAVEAVKGVDLVLLMVTADTTAAQEETFVRETLSGCRSTVLLVVNKIDLVERPRLLPLMAGFGDLGLFREIVPISAATGDGTERLLQVVRGYLTEGPAYFPDDILTDLPERFLAAEFIREKIFRFTQEEVPYAVAVTVDSFQEPEQGGVLAISATIHVERESQKGIIIGRRGELLKRIGTAARRDLENLLQTRVYLELFVRVQKNWREQGGALKEFGYR